MLVMTGARHVRAKGVGRSQNRSVARWPSNAHGIPGAESRRADRATLPAADTLGMPGKWPLLDADIGAERT